MKDLTTPLRAASFLLSAALAVALAFALRESDGSSSDLFYVAYAILAPSAAVFAGLIALARHFSRPAPAFLLVGAGLISAGALDALHGLLCLSGVIPGATDSAIVWSWFASRLILGVSLLLGFIAQSRPPSLDRPFWQRTLAVCVAAKLYILIAAAACLWLPLPLSIPIGVIPRGQELLTAAIFAAALGLCLRLGLWRRDSFQYWTALSLIYLLAAQALFMAWSSRPFDPYSNLGHLAAIVGYFLLFIGLLVDTHRIFVHAERSAEALGRANATLAAQVDQRVHAQEELRRLNDTLEQRVAQRTAELDAARLAALNIAEDAHESRLAVERAVAALAESEARLRAIVDTAPDGIITLDDQGRIQSFNPGASRLFGYAPDEVLGRDARELLASVPGDPPFWRLASAEPARPIVTATSNNATAAPPQTDPQARRKDGSTFPIDVSVASMHLPAGDRHVAIVRDITHRRRAEQAIRDAHAALARKYREIEEFLAIIAHDLKHPVVGIQGLLTLVKEDATGLDPQSIQSIDLCLAECERMRDLLTQLNQLGRIEGVTPKLERVALDRLVRGCVDRFRARLQEQGVVVVVEAPAIEATLPRSHVEEALINLIDNALKYGCPGHGSSLEIDCKVTEDRCNISVTDHGPGIDPKHHARVFQPFRRLVGEGAAGGSGIGLTAVHRLMARIGGAVTLESQLGRGARFTLRFPLESSEY